MKRKPLKFIGNYTSKSLYAGPDICYYSPGKSADSFVLKWG